MIFGAILILGTSFDFLSRFTCICKYFFDIIYSRNEKFENPSPDVFMGAGSWGGGGIPKLFPFKILKWAVFRKKTCVVKRVKGN